MKRRAKALPSHKSVDQTFLAHLHELRRRLYYVVASVIVGAGLAYAVEHDILAVLLMPANGQEFIYTSPMGGMNFLFNVCIYIGLIISIPVILFQILRFIEPMLPKHSSKFIYKVTFASAVLAIVGILFGYFVGLPNALHFLLNQFINQQVKPLVTIQSYMSFVGMYMLSSALLLQAPLVLLLINHIKPLKPSKLLGYERWVILLSFVGAFIMNPTPNVIAQSLVAVPIIISYHIGVLIIWLLQRRRRRPGHVMDLMAYDQAIQAERYQRAAQCQPVPAAALRPRSVSVTVQPAKPQIAAPTYRTSERPAHLRQYQTATSRTVRRSALIATI